MPGLLSVALVVAGGTAAGLAASENGCRLPPPHEKWLQVTSEHFTVMGNTPGKVATSACLRLERTLAALTMVTPMRLDAGVPLTVLIFGTSKSFDPIRAAITPGLGLPSSSFYLARDPERYIVVDAGVAVALETSLAHEVAHALVRTTIPRPPYWLDEGLAEFYETIEIRGSTLKIGIPIQEHVYNLRKKTWWPFEELLALPGDTPWNEVPARRGPPVSESWALVHYLLLGNPQRTGQLTRYLAALQDGVAVGPAFSAAFAATPSVLQEEVLSYVKRSSHPFATYKSAGLGISGISTPVEVPRAEVLAEIGLFLALAENPLHGTTQCYLAEVMRLDATERLGPPDPDLDGGTQESVVAREAALAERLLRAGRAADAVALLRNAVTLTSDEVTRKHLMERASEVEAPLH